jgi:hypothetical protein
MTRFFTKNNLYGGVFIGIIALLAYKIDAQAYQHLKNAWVAQAHKPSNSKRETANPPTHVAANAINMQGMPLPPKPEYDVLQHYFRQFDTYLIPDLAAISQALQANSGLPLPQKNASPPSNAAHNLATTDLRLQLGNEVGYLHLQLAHELITPNTTVRLQLPNGTISQLPAPQNFAYKGFYTSNDKAKPTPAPNASATMVRLCIAADYLGGIIGSDWVIQPLRDFVADAPTNAIVVYSPQAVIAQNNALCPIEQAQHPNPYTTHPTHDNTLRDGGDCLETARLALVADYSMTTLTGNTEQLIKHLISVTNAIQPAYLSINVQFEISEIYLSACSTCDPVSSITSAFALLDEFTAWGESSNNQLTQPYHLAQLWTNRAYSQSNLVGMANLGGLCTNERYCQVRNYSAVFDRLRCLSAHEIGHLFNAGHDGTSGNIMYGTINEYATAFSNVSINAMNTCIDNRPCLANCSDCKGVAQVKLLNYNGFSADLAWTHALNDSYIIKYKVAGAETWNTLSNNYTDTSYHFNSLSPCLGYDFWVQANCSNGNVSTVQNLSVIGKRATIYDLRTYNTDSIKISWNNIGSAMRLRLRETGTTTWFNDITIAQPDTSHTFNGLNPCKSYDLSMRVDCGGGLYGRDTLLFVRAASALSAGAAALSISTAQMSYQKSLTTSPDISFTLRYKRSSSSFWSGEIPNAAPNTYYPLSGLQPCTAYEVQAQAYCGTTAGNITSSVFTTGTVALLQPNVVNCNPNTHTYDLEVRVAHGGNMVGNTFSVSAGGVSQTFTYTNPTPQTVVLSNIPNTGAATATVTLFDSTYPSYCSDDANYTPPALVCDCQTAFWEDFNQCSLPCNWTTQNVADNNTAQWRAGIAHEGHSLDGTCMAYFDDDRYDNNGGETLQLISPIIDLSKYSKATLSFDYNFHTIDGNLAIEVFNGSTWVNIWQLNAGFCGFWGCPTANTTLNITPNLNAQFRVRWVYNDGNAWDWYAAIDNVEICGFSNLTTCNADFNYACDTLCKSGDAARPVLSGYGYGTFSATPAGLSLNASNGEIDPANSSAGNYTVTYTTTQNGTCSISRNVVIQDCSVHIRPRIYLQAAYNSTVGIMVSTLRSSGLLPLQQPYALAPWNYGGTEAYATNTNISTKAIDWVLLELRDAVYPDLVIARKAAMLYNDGWIADANAPTTQGVTFNGIANNAYYVAIKHRNHLGIMSAQPLNLSAQSTSYDFSSSATQAYNSAQVAIASNRYALFAGDMDGNGIINYADYNLYAAQMGMTNGYYAADLSLNKTVNLLDYDFYRPNARRISPIWIRD